MSHAGLTLAIALAAAVLAQSVSRQVRLPGIVLLLLTGALLGPEFASWIEPDALGDGLFAIVDFGVAIILFEGGLNLEWSRLKRQESAIRGSHHGWCDALGGCRTVLAVGPGASLRKPRCGDRSDCCGSAPT